MFPMKCSHITDSEKFEKKYEMLGRTYPMGDVFIIRNQNIYPETK